ncbi:MAG: GTP-binding protein [Promethearchaeota archaeon]|nr:MAG: GTP-binding protein [Candidatus Lokiarchaeota archaeon]
MLEVIERKWALKLTLGVDITLKDIILNEIKSEVHLIMWDIVGQNKYELTFRMFFQGSSGALLIYDITRYSTFKQITSKWLGDFKNFGRSDGVYILMGNKSDLKDSIIVAYKEGKKLSEEIDAVDFGETSAKYGENVEKAFRSLATLVLNKSGTKIKLD